MPLAIPKLEPEWVHLEQAATRIVEREPSLDIDKVRKTLCDAIAYRRLRVQSDDDPNDVLTWTAFRARRDGFIGASYADTWRMWMERRAEISWQAGIIVVSFGDHVVPIRLPRVRLAEAFALFETTTQETSPPEKVMASESPEELPASKALPKVPHSKLGEWYGERLKNWPPGQKSPSPEEDWAAARDFFKPKFRVTREQVLGKNGVRPELAPSHWTAKGRRPDFQDPDKLAEKLAIKLPDKPAKK
jgi:hypothetical protein